MSDNERGIFLTGSFGVDGVKSVYAVIKDEHVGGPQARYLCSDGKVRQWAEAVKEMGGDKANKIIIHSDPEVFEECLRLFEIANPEYYI